MNLFTHRTTTQQVKSSIAFQDLHGVFKFQIDASFFFMHQISVYFMITQYFLKIFNDFKRKLDGRLARGKSFLYIDLIFFSPNI